MRRSFPVAAVALLIALSPAYAMNLPNASSGTIARQQNHAKADGVSRAGRDRRATDVIILDRDSLEALPNPYSNPEPRMISDVWAMRT